MPSKRCITRSLQEATHSAPKPLAAMLMQDVITHVRKVA